MNARMGVVEPLGTTYERTPVGRDAWMVPDDGQSLTDFQMAVASAQAWEFVGFLKILEVRQERVDGRDVVTAVRFQRLR